MEGRKERREERSHGNFNCEDAVETWESVNKMMLNKKSHNTCRNKINEKESKLQMSPWAQILKGTTDVCFQLTAHPKFRAVFSFETRPPLLTMVFKLLWLFSPQAFSSCFCRASCLSVSLKGED